MSFVEQLSRWVRLILGPELRRNINRLLDRGLRRLLLVVVRGPVLGTRGEAGLAVTVTPDPPVEQPIEGLYGQPYPGNPHPDPGALWLESAGLWTGLIYPDWQDEFPYPPGVLAGNVFHENTVAGHLVSWHWYTAAGPPGNAIKYLQSPSKFDAWARAEQQDIVAGGNLSRDVLHVGRRLYRLPDHWACIGACTANSWLFMVGLNTSGRGRSWVWSGYNTADDAICAAPFFTEFSVIEHPALSPGIVFSVGTEVLLGSEERVVTEITGPTGPQNCWRIRLSIALTVLPAAGTPIDIVKPGGAFGGYTTRVFAVATTTDIDGDLEVVPGETLYDLADLMETRWTQQFVAHPNGLGMMSLVFVSSTDVNRDIHRLAFDTGSAPPIVDHTIETRVEKRDQIYIEAIDDARVIHDCTYTDTDNRRRDEVESGQPCFSCGTGTYYFMYDWVYSGQSVLGYSRDIEDRMGRKIDDQYKLHTLAVDYNANGDELVATLEIDYQSTITVRTQNDWSVTQTASGTLSLSPYCVGLAEQWNNTGQYTDIRDERSTLLMEYRLETDFSVHLAVNGVKKLDLGTIQDDFKWYNEAATQSGFDTRTSIYEGNGWRVNFCPGGEPACEHPDLNQIRCVETLSLTLVNEISDSGGTIVQGPDCADLLTYDYEQFYPAEAIAYDVRNIATPLLFMDLRSGVYVTQGREGIVDEIYQLPETAGNSAFSHRQIYPYTVEEANFLPEKPALQDRGDYDQHWAAWGVDFAPEAAVGSPAPVWLGIGRFDKKDPTDLINPCNISPIADFVDTDDNVEQGAAIRNGKILVNVYVELPTAGQETLQAVELRNPTGDPLGSIGIPGATKIANIGAI